MSDEDSPIINKLYSTPSSKDKTVSKFKNIIDDIELKMKKHKKSITSSNLDTNSNTNNKIENNKSSNDNKKEINKFNSFENGKIKKAENKKKTFNKTRNQNSSLLSRINQEKEKLKSIKNNNFTQRNSINSINSIKININNNNNKKLRTSTPGIRDNEENKDKTNKKEKENKIDPLYIPHIIKDPLDIFKQKIEIILEQSNEEINNLSNKISLIDIEMESAFAQEHENYSKNLETIYKEKETKLKETYKKYDFALYKMFKTYGEKNNIIYDEMMKDKVEQILEIEQELNNKKNKLKNNLNEKIEEVKKSYEKKRQEQEIFNKKYINDIKKKIYNLLYDKNDNDIIQKNKNEKNISYNNKEEGNKKIIKTKSFFSSKK